MSDMSAAGAARQRASSCSGWRSQRVVNGWMWGAGHEPGQDGLAVSVYAPWHGTYRYTDCLSDRRTSDDGAFNSEFCVAPEKTDDGYLLSVSSLTLLRGGQQVWQGEQVRDSKQYVNSAFERRFSMGRTIGAGAIVVGGFAAFLATRSLLGAGQSETTPPSDSGQTHVGRP